MQVENHVSAPYEGEMLASQTKWQLDLRLEGDTFEIDDRPTCALRLMNDSRWLWIILVPKVAGASELHDLPPHLFDPMMTLSRHVGERLQAHTGCEKINTAAIGNMVRQLHIHIIARQTGDPNWPAPVWGFGEPVAYEDSNAQALCQKLKALFDDPLLS